MSYLRLDDLSEDPTASRSDPVETVHTRQPLSLWGRCLPVASTVLATSLGGVPLALRWGDFYFSKDSSMYSYVRHDSPSVQVVVSIIAAVIAFFWLWGLCASFNLAVRIRLSERRNILLDALRLRVAITNRTVDWNMPAMKVGLALLWAAATMAPARLWTGALTPHITTRVNTCKLLVPTTGERSQTVYAPMATYDPSVWQGGTYRDQTYNDAPGQFFSGRLLDAISNASPLNGTTVRNHSKYDNSLYTWHGRSFGAGAFVGLVPLLSEAGASIGPAPLPSDAAEYYNYTEAGLVVNATCIRNVSSAWGAYTPVTSFNPRTYNILGNRPNQPATPDPENGYAWGYKQFAFPNNSLDLAADSPIAAVSFSAGSAGGLFNGTPPFELCITASTLYGALNQTQCALAFQTAPVAVNVSVAERKIRATPLNDRQAAPVSPQQGAFIERALHNLQTITMVETSAFISTTGSAFATNLNRNRVDSAQPLDARGLELVAQSVEAALDDILAALSTFALTDAANGSRYADVTCHLTVVEVGNAAYSVVLFAASVVSLAAILTAVAYTRLFAHAPAFDVMDLGSVAAGACHQATDEERRSGVALAHLASWGGSAGDTKLRASQLEFQCKLGGKGTPLVVVKPTTLEIDNESRGR